MNKKGVLWILLDSVFFIVFNVIFFAIIGTDHGAAGWISYVFIMLAYILLIVTPYLVRNSKSKAVFGFSLYVIGSVYFLVELIVGIVFILVTSTSFKVVLLVQILLFGIYAVLLISHMIANEKTAESEGNREYDLQYVKRTSLRLQSIMEGIPDKNLRKKVEKAYDIISSSPVGSNLQAKEIEGQITQLVGDLESAVDGKDAMMVGNIAEQLVSMANERNKLVAVNK